MSATDSYRDADLVADCDALIAGMEKCADAWWGGIGNADDSDFRKLREIAYRIRARASHGGPKSDLSVDQWRLVPQDEPLGSFLTGVPGKPIYAIDERGVQLNTPFRVWALELPPLPDMPNATRSGS